MNATPRHLITGTELDRAALSGILDRAEELKAGRSQRIGCDSLLGRSVALVFELPSTRTRVSFEVGVAELGAHPVVLSGSALQLSRGESVADTARVLSRYVAAIVIRSRDDADVAGLAEASEVPVVNALTAEHHPCQALADLLTLRERFGELDGLRVAFVGDGNNVARSLAVLGRTAGLEVVVASPAGYELEDGLCETVSDPAEAAEGAVAVYTDVWASMGDESDAERRNADFAGFRLDQEVMSKARDDAIALHCLPAHPGQEISAEVLYGSQSAVWDQAENRLHTQKALLEYLIDAQAESPPQAPRP
jgi:ornithine carbamoyltransferase